MNSRRVGVLVLGCVLVLSGVRGGLARPSPDEKSSFATADGQIIGEIRDHSEVMANLEYLSDSIGQRMTGSPQLKQANDWTKQKFTEYGLTNVHLEAWTMARAWTRGTASARIVTPAEHPLTIAAAAWSPSTPGVVQGQVVYFDVKKKEDFGKFHGKLKGAVVIYQEPESLSPPKTYGPVPRRHPSHAAAASTNGRGSNRRSVQCIHASGERADAIFQGRGRCGRPARLQ